jgi:hypothetical protein
MKALPVSLTIRQVAVKARSSQPTGAQHRRDDGKGSSAFCERRHAKDWLERASRRREGVCLPRCLSTGGVLRNCGAYPRPADSARDKREPRRRNSAAAVTRVSHLPIASRRSSSSR